MAEVETEPIPATVAGVVEATAATGRIFITASMTSAICSGEYFSRSRAIDSGMKVADIVA
jgi:predicted secreted protein